jgi:trimeric autotransporter adhesin
MKIVSALLFLFTLTTFSAIGQSVGIGTNAPNNSALLEIRSNNKGVMIPKINLQSETDITTINSPALSLLIYNTNASLPQGEGFYFWNGGSWAKLATRTNLTNLTWGIAGNSSTNPVNDFIGTIDNKALVFKTNSILSGKIDPGPNNVFWGQSAGLAITSGLNNTFIGHVAGLSDTSGSNNTFLGHNAGNLTSSGNENVFLGQDAGKVNTTGSRNVVIGEDAGISLTTGSDNVIIGNGAARLFTGGGPIVAIGFDALSTMDLSNESTAIGYKSLATSNFGANTAIGYASLQKSTIGDKNTAVGISTLFDNTTGVQNTAIGYTALTNNTIGYGNTSLGYRSLEYNVSGNTNTAVGYLAGPPIGSTALSNTTALGARTEVTTDNTMVFGNTDVIRFAFGLSTTTGNHVIEVGSNGGDGNGAFLTQGGTWTNTSDVNKKSDFSDLDTEQLMRKISELKIQKWRYKETNEYHIGPVAQQFYQLFQLGEDEKGISTIDPAGIALAAIQQLIKDNEELRKRIEQLEKLTVTKK